jgi:hypothetical protein
MLAATKAFAQKDAPSGAGLNSVIISEQKIGTYLLGASYYPLKGNMDNRKSSAYVTDSPTLLEIDYAATHQASDFFVIVKNHSILKVIGLNNLGNKWQWLVVDMDKGGSDGFMLTDTADLTENRAKELVGNRYDRGAKIIGNILYFNGRRHRILSNTRIKGMLLGLISREGLANGDSTDVKYRTREETEAYVLAATAPGRELDFFTSIAGHEYDGVQVKPGKFSTKLGIALYQWGKACFDLGVNTLEDAWRIFEKFRKRPLDQRERDYIKMGFERALED